MRKLLPERKFLTTKVFHFHLKIFVSSKIFEEFVIFEDLWRIFDLTKILRICLRSIFRNQRIFIFIFSSFSIFVATLIYSILNLPEKTKYSAVLMELGVLKLQHYIQKLQLMYMNQLIWDMQGTLMCQVHSVPKWVYKKINSSEVWCIFLKTKLYDNSKKSFLKIFRWHPSPLDTCIF